MGDLAFLEAVLDRDQPMADNVGRRAISSGHPVR